MVKILAFARDRWPSMVLIVLLLFLQVQGDLALPSYTSAIVDVGISSQGIEQPIPEKMSAQTFSDLKLFLNEDSAARMDILYKEKDGQYLADFSSLDPDSLKALQSELLIPETLLYFVTAQGDDAEQMRESALGLLSDNTSTDDPETEASSDVSASAGMNSGGTDLSGIDSPGIDLSGMDSAGMDLSGMGSAGMDLSGMSSAGMDLSGMDFSGMLSMFRLLPASAREPVIRQISARFENYPETMLESMGKRFVASEYEALGINMDRYQMNYLIRTGLKMLAIAIAIALIGILIGFLSSRMAAFTSRSLRSRIFSKVMSFSNAEMNQFSTASLITRCTNDVQQVQMVLTMIFRVVLMAPIMGIGAVLKVMNSAASMTWIIVLAVVALMTLILALLLIAMPKFRIMQQLVDRLNLVAREVLGGLPVIRAFGRESFERSRFEEASKNLYDTQLFTSRTMSIMMPAMTFLMSGVSLLIVWVGAHHIDSGSLQVGEMMAFLTYAMQIIMSFLMLSAISIILPRASVAAERIQAVLDSRTQIVDPGQPQHLAPAGTSAHGEIRFKDVSFRYPGAAQDALRHLDFTVPAGTTTAIIGGTGSGKSTLVQLIPRLYDVTEGCVTVGGADVRTLSMEELRKSIGFVPQKGTLFSGTISSNILFGAPDAGEEQMKRSARIAQAADFIAEKAMGYESEISQGGTNVSGGQKQRLAIARAIAKHPDIYIFDDSFSALDFQTDAALRKALSEEVGDATVLIVAQRISTILGADQILVMDDGAIVGKGTHARLMQSCEVYRQIAQSQLSEEELANYARPAGSSVPNYTDSQNNTEASKNAGNSDNTDERNTADDRSDGGNPDRSDSTHRKGR